MSGNPEVGHIDHKTSQLKPLQSQSNSVHTFRPPFIWVNLYLLWHPGLKHFSLGKPNGKNKEFCVETWCDDMSWCRLSWRQSPIVGFSEHGTGPSKYIKGRKYFDYLNDLLRTVLRRYVGYKRNTNFTFTLPCVVMDLFLNNQPDALNSQILFCYKTLHLSVIFSAHHQELSTVHSALVIFMQVFDDLFQAESGWNCSSWRHSI